MTAGIFGKVLPEVRNVGNVRRLADDLQALAKESREAVVGMVRKLEDRLKGFGLDSEQADRCRTARAVGALTGALANSEGNGLIDALAGAEIATSETAMGTALAQASSLRALLESDDWLLYEQLQSIGDHRAAGAKKILEDIEDALRHDEHVVSLKTALAAAKRRGISLLSETAPPPKPEPTPRDRPGPQPGRHIVESDRRSGLGAQEAKSLFQTLQRKLNADPKRTATVQWTIDEPETPS